MREKLIELLADVGLCHYDVIADSLIANGVTIPVRCKDCVNGIYDEVNDIYKCVKSAEMDSEFGDWIGFVSYHNADYYCADGERKDNGKY